MVTHTKDESKTLIALSPVIDYEMRPPELSAMSLYDWIRLTEKQKIPKQRKKSTGKHALVDEDSDIEMNEQSQGPTTRAQQAGTSQRTLVAEGDDDCGYSSDVTMIADDENDEDYTDDDENSDASDMEDSHSSRTSRKTRKNVRPLTAWGS